MKLSSKNSLRRARPLLGTIVEIRVAGDGRVFPMAVEAAFEEMERLQRLLSFHDASSDVSLLNRATHKTAVAVAPETWSVLKTAQEISEESEGVFDITVAPQLVRWGYLPGVSRSTLPKKSDYRQIEILPHNHVRFRKPVMIDLGGIGKGFIVDQAVKVLERYEGLSGIVNAGGDLRAFGKMKWPVSIRDPRLTGQSIPFHEVQKGALATSGVYFSRRRVRNSWISPLVDPQGGRPFSKRCSVTVMADTCIVADALTKVVALRPESSKNILRRFNSQAFVAGTNGTIRGLN